MARFPTGVVIVGGSAAGLSAADGLREGGYDGAITVLDENIEPGFDRPMLSKGLVAQGAGAQPLELRSPATLAERDITVLAGHGAVGLDTDRRLVVTNYGEAIPWENLIIASGVDARRLSTTAGTPLPALRNLADLALVHDMCDSHREITIVGGGFIGLEVASSLRARGIDVMVFCPNPLPLVQTLGEDVATWLRALHRDNGVRLELDSMVATVEEVGDGYRLHLDDGRTHECDAVLAGVGVVSRTDWLTDSGVELDDGVVIDPAGRTTVPGIWAAGDVARTVDPGTGERDRFEHWTHAIEQGRHVGLNVVRGTDEPYDAVPYVWTEQHGHTLHMYGRRRPDDEDTLVRGSLDSDQFVVVHGRGDEFRAATICGLPKDVRTYKKLLRSGATLADALAASA